MTKDFRDEKGRFISESQWNVASTQKAEKLLKRQSNRFYAVPPDRQTARKLAEQIKLKDARLKYIDEIAEELDSLEDINEVNAYLQDLIEVEEMILNDPVTNIANIPSATTSSATPTVVASDEASVKKSLIKTIINKFKTIKEYLKKLNPSDIIKEMAKYTTAISLYELYNKIGLPTTILRSVGLGDNLMIADIKTPCVLSVIPLIHVREIEVARSGKILKFRATGSVFLANQEGGLDAVRIEFYLYRSEIIWLIAYWYLFMYGQSKTKEITTPADVPFLDADGRINLRKLNDIVSYNSKTSKPSYEFHRTFPFITKHIIIPNVYIETMSFEAMVENGLDCVKCDVLLRTYRKPTGFEIYRTKNFGFAGLQREDLKFYKVIEAGTNLAWRMANAEGLVSNEKSWRISSETAGRDDVYYDIDPKELIAYSALSLFGVVAK